MTAEVFAQTLQRATELRSQLGADFPIQLCGLGEPLINPLTPSFVRQIREAGFECGLSSNASLLDEKRGRALLDAGLQSIHINVGEEGSDYESVYKLPFQRTRDNVLRFFEMAGKQCRVDIVLVDYKRDPAHRHRMTEYWRSFGLKRFMYFDLINRGGALFVDDMLYQGYPETAQARELLRQRGIRPACAAPFVFLFVGYNGQYYLCCSDWKKEAPLGSVFDTSFVEITKRKFDHVASREPVCKKCNLDPINELTGVLRQIKSGSEPDRTRDELLESIATRSKFVDGVVAELAAAEANSPKSVERPRVTIPIVAR